MSTLGKAVVVITGDMGQFAAALKSSQSQLNVFFLSAQKRKPVTISADMSRFSSALKSGMASLKGFGQAGEGMSRALSVGLQGASKGLKGFNRDIGQASKAIQSGFEGGFSGMGQGITAGLGHALSGLKTLLSKSMKGLTQGIAKNADTIGPGMAQGFGNAFRAVGSLAGIAGSKVVGSFRLMGQGAAGAFRGLTGIASRTFQGIVSRARSSMASVRNMIRGGLLATMGHGLMGGMGMTAMMGPGGAAMAAGAGMAAGLRTALTSASDLNESINKLGVIFGDSAGVVEAGANEMAKKFGVVKTEFIDSSSEIGNLLQQMGGMSADTAAKMAVELNQAATDAASVFNTSFSEASEKVQAAIRGMSRPIASFGIDTQEAAVKQEAMRMGLIKTSRELTTQEKVMARTSLVLKGLHVAKGDRGNTADMFANITREVKGRFQNLMAILGQSALPMAEGFLGAIAKILGGVESLVGAAKPQIDGFVGMIGYLVDYVKWAAVQIGEAFVGHASHLIEEVQQWSIYKAAVEAVGQVWEWLKGVAAETFEAIGVVFRNWSSIMAEATIRGKGYIVNLGELFSWLLDAAGKFLGWFGRNWATLILDAFKAVGVGIVGLATNFSNLFKAIGDWFSGKGFEFNWTPILQGFRATVEELPQIAAPALTSVQDEIDAIRIQRDEDIQEQEDKRLADRNKPKPPGKLEPVRGERIVNEPVKDPGKEAKEARKKREQQEKVFDAMISVRRAKEDLAVHNRGGGGGEFKGLTQFAQDIQSGALGTAEYYRKSLRLQEDLLKAMQELSDATFDQGNSYDVAAP